MDVTDLAATATTQTQTQTTVAPSPVLVEYAATSTTADIIADARAKHPNLLEIGQNTRILPEFFDGQGNASLTEIKRGKARLVKTNGKTGAPMLLFEFSAKINGKNRTFSLNQTMTLYVETNSTAGAITLSRDEYRNSKNETVLTFQP